MIIRTEKPEDFAAIYDLVKVAFQTAKFPTAGSRTS